MYRPNFCAQCGEKIIRLRWRLWTSRKFCDDCAPHLRTYRILRPAMMGISIFSLGFVAGRAGRPASPPLVIERSQSSPLSSSGSPPSIDSKGRTEFSASLGSNSGAEPADGQQTRTEEEVYICGARTKKGTPCSRRVHGPVRCWQHKGLPAMLALEKLKVKE